MKKIAALATASLAVSTLLVGLSTPVQAAPDWNKRIRCTQKDWEGRTIPTRYGNSEFGWNHFTHKHNVKKCKVVEGPLDGKPDKRDGARLEYHGIAIDGSRHVKIVVIVQWARKTRDGDYDAGRGQKIGVINTFCKNQPRNKCPNWVSQ